MTGFCGWLGAFGDTSGSEVILDSMMAGLYPAVNPLQAFDFHAACGVVGGGKLAKPTDVLIVAIAGYPYWSDPDLKQLAMEHGDALALADAYKKHDTALFDYLHGAFSFVVLDIADNRLIAAIDRIGQLPLYYALVGNTMVFGSTADSVCAHPKVDHRLSSQGIFNYVYFHMLPSPGCIYAAQRKLPGGHYVEYHAGSLSTTCYWQPHFTEPDNTCIIALGGEMHDLILTSVRRLSAGKKVGAFLSGGLDSSTVAGMLAQLRPADAKTFSIGFAVDGYDETGYARIAARHFKTQQHEYYVTPQDVTAMIPTIAGSYDEPFGNSSVVPAYYCAKLALENGVERMLGGDGGDELFAGNQHYAKQDLFEHYHRLPAFLRRRILEAVLFSLPDKLALIRKAQSYVEQANVPLPDRLHSYNFLHRHAPDEVFTKDFLATVEIEEPLRLQQAQYQCPAESVSVLNRMLYLDWQQTLADNDLRKVNRMCALAGVEVVYPLLDDNLVEFSCRVPSKLKLKGQHLRYFYKQAMCDFLPTEIIKKSKHGFGLPFGIWMQSYPPLQELVYDSLLQLKRKNRYFRGTFIDHAIEMHRINHKAYYGELIWILMMLDLWLERHAF